VTAQLTVRVVGAFEVCRSGRQLVATEVGSSKARTLVAMLAVHHGHLSVDRIVAVLWGDVSPRHPVRNTATLVSRLRATLGPDSIAGGRAGYRLGDHVLVDLYEADGLVDQAEARTAGQEPALALAAATRALRLLGIGGVLDEAADARWAEPARALHGGLLRRARHVAAEAALRIGDVRAARVAAEAAVAADPFDEAACRMLMRAHWAAGEPARALIAYDLLRATLGTELGVDPAAPTRDLHLAILRGLVGAGHRT
jgi:DNA-binding SARP family transcriptional activator